MITGRILTLHTREQSSTVPQGFEQDMYRGFMFAAKRSCYLPRAMKIAASEKYRSVGYGLYVAEGDLFRIESYFLTLRNLCRNLSTHCVVNGNLIEFYHTFHPLDNYLDQWSRIILDLSSSHGFCT